jgi:hypothetical protein
MRFRRDVAGAKYISFLVRGFPNEMRLIATTAPARILSFFAC